jgi:hypothetical protein
LGLEGGLAEVDVDGITVAKALGLSRCWLMVGKKGKLLELGRSRAISPLGNLLGINWML